MEDEETVMLIDKWKDQKSLDIHHDSPLMSEIVMLRDKYDLHMRVEKFITSENTKKDEEFIRK